MPTSATGWKYDPLLPAGSSPSASNWAAMYFAANLPPRVAGARPSSRSSAKYFRCASIAAVFTAGMDAHLKYLAHDLLEGRSEEHTSELQSRSDLLCRPLLEKENMSSSQSGPPVY